MNATTGRAKLAGANGRETSVSTDERDWGYIVRCPACDSPLRIVKQWGAAFFGVLCFILAVGLWVLPGSMMSSDITGFKLAMSGLSGVLGMTLIWFAAHGTRTELQVNLVRNELREVLRDARGRAQVQSRTGFANVKAVFIDATPMKNGKSRLLLGLENPTLMIEVARDYKENLVRLRDRLGRDILEHDEVAGA